MSKRAEQNTAATDNGNGKLTVVVPTVPWADGYCRIHIDVKLTRIQARTLKEIKLGLEHHEAQLQSGRFVSNEGDAIRWMLENAKGHLA